jgi:hypothetical protein
MQPIFACDSYIFASVSINQTTVTDKLCKIKTLFGKLSDDAYAKFYDPPESLAVNKFDLLFKGRVTFKLYLP